MSCIMAIKHVTISVMDGKLAKNIFFFSDYQHSIKPHRPGMSPPGISGGSDEEKFIK